jgi:hypothetical protein
MAAKQQTFTFDRWKTTNVRTLAYRKFKAHHTEINNLYWSHHAAKAGAYRLTKGKPETDDCDSVLPNTRNERRRSITLGQWSESYVAFDNWSRLSAVIAATGYLEVFVKTIVDAACQSCPAILIGGTKQIDGITLLKTRAKYGFAKQAEACAKGTWQTRIRAYEDIFGNCPPAVANRVSDLDKLRNLRNAVGHAFGRKLGPTEIGKTLGDTPAVIVSQEALKNHLSLVNDVADAIEDHLSDAYIGCYETLAAYHFWADRGSGMSHERKMFKKHFNKVEDVGISQTYFDNLIKFYHSK